MPAIILRSVVLPDPFSPFIRLIDPLSKVRLIFFKISLLVECAL